MVITLNTDTINALDLSQCKARAPYFDHFCGHEHYRLLCYLSTLYNDALFVDIGTSEGDSALALGYNTANRVISFDIEWRIFNPIPNCLYLLEDFHDHLPAILNSEIILYDIPHEKERFVPWCEMLKKSGWDGFLILDDFTFDPIKNAEWNRLTDFVKLDVTKYGHFSGTGIVNFSTKTEFRLE